MYLNFTILIILYTFCFPKIVIAQEQSKISNMGALPNVTISTDKKTQKTISDSQRNKDSTAFISSESKKTRSDHRWTKRDNLVKLINILNKYSSLFSAAAALFAGLIALYLGDWKEKLAKPKLKLAFNETKEYPFFQTLSFGNFGVPVDINGQLADISGPGFNARVMVENKGKRVAKHVEAKIEKIEFYKDGKETSPTRHYHPTTVKWSGEKDWTPVNIVPNSHFFLDLFWAKNEKTSEILSFNEYKLKSYGICLKRELLKEIIDNDIKPSQEIFWNVWVDNSYDRGLPKRYDIQGEIYIYFVINAENCSPLRFKAIIDWTRESWNYPDITIEKCKIKT